MANVLAPFGFAVARRTDAASPNYIQSHRLISPTNNHSIFFGDVVVSLSTGFIDLATVVGGGAQIAGVFVGCEYNSVSQSRRVFTNHYSGSSDVLANSTVDAYIIDDPAAVFLAQTAGTSNNPIGLTAIGNNVNFNTTAASGNALSGLSGMTVDDNLVNTTATLPFRVIGIPGLDVPNLGASVNGYDTTTRFNLVLVAFNNQDYKSLTGI